MTKLPYLRQAASSLLAACLFASCGAFKQESSAPKSQDPAKKGIEVNVEELTKIRNETERLLKLAGDWDTFSKAATELPTIDIQGEPSAVISKPRIDNFIAVAKANAQSTKDMQKKIDASADALKANYDKTLAVKDGETSKEKARADDLARQLAEEKSSKLFWLNLAIGILSVGTVGCVVAGIALKDPQFIRYTVACGAGLAVAGIVKASIRVWDSIWWIVGVFSLAALAIYLIRFLHHLPPPDLSKPTDKTA